MKVLFAAAACGALLIYPETALNAAREAMCAWYMTVAPALFPFMALMPMLTCEAGAQMWERLMGRAMRPVFNLPGAAAPAVVVGMIAGSPAGAHAIAKCHGLGRSQRARLLYCVGGLSPAFLITGVGAAMLGSPVDGHILLRAQIAAQITMLLLTRGVRDEPSMPTESIRADAEPIRAAVAGVLSVCGYMMLFNIAAALIAKIARSQTAGLAALCLLDVPSAARAVANLSICREGKLLAIAALIGFGGLCIAVQNLAAAKKIGVRPGKYLVARACHAALNTGFTAVQMQLKPPKWQNQLPTMEFSALIAVFLLVPALISLKKDLFLNKRNSAKPTGK